MNLSKLLESGGFVSDAPVKKTVTWKRTVDGEQREDTFDVFVRKQSFGSMEAIYGNDADRSKMSKYIAESIVDEAGKPVMPYANAVRLEQSLGLVLIGAINEVNGVGKVSEKN